MRILLLQIPAKVLVIFSCVFNAREIGKVLSKVTAQLPRITCAFWPCRPEQVTKIESRAVWQVSNSYRYLVLKLLKHLSSSSSYFHKA